ncbi:MAG: HEAT repeat domain-containing protein [Bryobacteraceae bacterium]
MIGLATVAEADSEEIRGALLARLDDEYEYVRQEAVLGLGKRKDVRLLPKLFAILEKGEFSGITRDAAAAMLEMDLDLEVWNAEDCMKALRRKYPGSS